jgi:serine/threonine-protein kinase RsbW
MTMENPGWTLTLSSDSRMLTVTRAFVEAICQIANFDKPQIHAIVLAAGEAFTNIVRHAHQNRPGARIQIQCWLHSDSLEVRFHDEGEPFDLNAVPHFNPKEIRLGGRGVYLMRTLMDELSCMPRSGGGNTLRMVKLRQPTMRNCG